MAQKFDTTYFERESHQDGSRTESQGPLCSTVDPLARTRTRARVPGISRLSGIWHFQRPLRERSATQERIELDRLDPAGTGSNPTSSGDICINLFEDMS